MNDPARMPLWASLQAELLVVSSILIGLYLLETWKLRKAAQGQISESQRLVTAAQQQLQAIWRQVEIANDQLENQIRPAIAVEVIFRGGSWQLDLSNVGSGPAFGIRFSATEKGRGADGGLPSVVEWRIGFLAAHATTPTSLQIRNAAGNRPIVEQSLQCEYESLSGRTLYTLVDFSADRSPDFVHVSGTPQSLSFHNPRVAGRGIHRHDDIGNHCNRLQKCVLAKFRFLGITANLFCYSSRRCPRLDTAGRES